MLQEPSLCQGGGMEAHKQVCTCRRAVPLPALGKRWKSLRIVSWLPVSSLHGNRSAPDVKGPAIAGINSRAQHAGVRAHKRSASSNTKNLTPASTSLPLSTKSMMRPAQPHIVILQDGSMLHGALQHAALLLPHADPMTAMFICALCMCWHMWASEACVYIYICIYMERIFQKHACMAARLACR